MPVNNNHAALLKIRMSQTPGSLAEARPPRSGSGYSIRCKMIFCTSDVPS